MSDISEEGLYESTVEQTDGQFRLGFGEKTELDVYAAPQLCDQLRGLLGDTACSQLTVDLRNVAYMDSTALGALVEARYYNNEVGNHKDLQLDVRGTDRIRKLFLITGLDGVFKFVEDNPGEP